MLRRWTPLDIRQFVESPEGKIWLARDTECPLNRLSEIDALIQQLMQAAGITIVESAQDPHPEDLGREAPITPTRITVWYAELLTAVHASIGTKATSIGA